MRDCYLNKRSIYSILLLWLVSPTRENTSPEAYDLFEAAMHDEQAGRKKEALEKYEKVVEIFPEFESAWLNMAMVQQDLGNQLLCISIAEKALEHLPTSTAIWGSLGSFYNRMGIVDKAEDSLRKAIDCNSDNSLAMSNLGLLLARKGDLKEAEKFLSKSRDVNPEGIGESPEWDAHIKNLIAQIRSELEKTSGTSSDSKKDKEIASILGEADTLARKGELSKAEDLVKKATKKNPDSVDLWNLLAQLYYSMGRHSDEKEAFRRVLEIDEDHETAGVDLAATLIGEDSFQEAEKLLGHVIAKNPNNHIAWMNLGKIRLRQGDDGAGEEAMKKVIELKPDYVNAHFQLGKLYLHKGDFEHAASAFQKTVQYKPEHVDAWIEMGIALSQIERGDEAEEAWRTAIKYDSNNDAPWINLSSHLSMSGRCDEAKEALTRAQELAPSDEYVIKAELLWKSMCGGGANTDISKETLSMDSINEEYSTYINTGAVMVDTGRLQDAEKCYRKAIEIDKSNPIGWGMLGNVLRAAGKLEEAEKAFNETLNLPTKAPVTVMVNYTVLLKQLGREEEAEKVLIQLTKENPDFALGWFNLGNVYLKRSDWKPAEKMYKKALDKKPEPNLMVKIKWNRGFAFKEMKEYKKAEKSLLEALELDPTNQSIRTILEQVRTLR